MEAELRTKTEALANEIATQATALGEIPAEDLKVNPDISLFDNRVNAVGLVRRRSKHTVNGIKIKSEDIA